MGGQVSGVCIDFTKRRCQEYVMYRVRGSELCNLHSVVPGVCTIQFAGFGGVYIVQGSEVFNIQSAEIKSG